VPNCYGCTVGILHGDPLAIGVCVQCNNLACAGHGGRILGVSQFKCGSCVSGACTISSGGPKPPPPPGGGGLGIPGPPHGPAGGPGDGAGVVFRTSFEFEIQMPTLARASEQQRRQIQPAAMREALRQLFRLLRDEDAARDNFLQRAVAELAQPVLDHVTRQVQQSDALGPVLNERGGIDALAEASSWGIISRVSQWISDDLAGWMAQIHTPVDETLWLGERFANGGAIDLLLLADGIGLFSYMWDLAPRESPFRRLEVVGGVDTGMLVLSQLYSQSMPVVQGMA